AQRQGTQRSTGRTACRQGVDGTSGASRLRSGAARQGVAAVVSTPAASAGASAAREMGAPDRENSLRGSDQEDEDAVGKLQRRGPSCLAESGTDQEARLLSGVRARARTRAPA